MKVIVKATGEIVEAELKGFDNLNIAHYIINGNQNWILSEFSLEFLELDPNPDYWSRLEHQAAIAAMQGILSNPESELDYKDDETFPSALAGCAAKLAHALVEKMKEEQAARIFNWHE